MIVLINGRLTQWDIGRKISIVPENDDIVDEVHFYYEGDTEGYRVEVTAEADTFVANIPNILLQENKTIEVCTVAITEDGIRTLETKSYRVYARKKPPNYIYTETEAISLKTAIRDAVKEFESSIVPRMSTLDERDGNDAVEDYDGEGVKFSDVYNRVYVEMSRGRGVYSRYCLTASPNAPLDPDPKDYAEGKKLDSVPMRMGDGFIRVPISEYGKTQPITENDSYDEEQRAMSKKYIDSGIESRVAKLNNSDTFNKIYVEQSNKRGTRLIPFCNGPEATSDHIPQRTKDGLMRCNTPENGADYICANKGYVDNFAKELLLGLDSIITAQNELLGG